jgi:hypothetical protein
MKSRLFVANALAVLQSAVSGHVYRSPINTSSQQSLFMSAKTKACK